MKSEKLSTEIAALQRKQKETKNAVAKKALSSKIERLKKELDEITTSAQAKTALAKAQSKIREMSQKDFGEFVKKLAAKPEFSFLKGMSKSKIKDDIMRVAKPVGWRFRGRTNVKKPTKKDIQEGNNVYYEGRVNRSDVSRTVRLAKGGGVDDVFNSVKDYLDKNKFSYEVKQSPYVKGMYSFKINDKGFDLTDSGKIEKLHKGINVSSSTNSNVWTIHLPSSSWNDKYANGGGVGVPKKPKYKIGQLVYSYQNKDTKYPINYIKEADDLGIIRYRLSLPNGNSNWINEESIYGEKYANGGKTDFGMLSVKAGIDNNPNPTYADKIAGAKMKKMAEGGGVGKDRYNLSFNYNPSIVKNEYAEGIVSKYTNDWKHDNDWDEVTFYVEGLTKEQSYELKAELKMEDVYNVEIEKSAYKYSKGGGVDMESVEEEIRSLRSRIKSLEEINTKEAYEQSNELRRQLSYLQAKYLHIKDLKYAEGGKIGDALYQEITSGIQLDDWWEGHDRNTNVQVFNKDGDIYFLRSKGFYEEGKDYKLSKLTKEEAIEFGWLDKYATGGGVGEREKSIKNILKGKKYPLTPKELKDLSNKSGYSQGDIEYVFQKINNDLQYKVEYANGGGVGHSELHKMEKELKELNKSHDTSATALIKYQGLVDKIAKYKTKHKLYANGGGVGEMHRSEESGMMAHGGSTSSFKYEIYAENTKTGEKSTVALVKAYGDIPLMITGLKMGVISSPIKYGFKEIK